MIPRQWLIPLHVLICSTLACSLTATNITPTPLDDPEEIGNIVRLDERPIESSDVNAAGDAGIGPTPLPGINENTQTVTQPSNPNCTVPTGWTTYTVKEGEFLSLIASKHDTTSSALQEANCLDNPRILQIGQVLVVPGDGTSSGTTALTTTTAVIPTASTDNPTVDVNRILAAPQTVDIYLVLETPDGRVGGLEAGCGNMLVPIAQTVYGADTPDHRVEAALEALLDIQAGTVNEYQNPLSQSTLTVDSVNIDTGIARVALSGDIEFAGVCEIPLVRGQIEQTILDDSSVNSAQITINGQSIDAVFSQR